MIIVVPHFLIIVLGCVLCFVQSIATENCSQYFSKEAGDVGKDGKARTVHPQFTIFHDHLQHSTAKESTVDHTTAVSDHEEMELHPSVTAEFVPETFAVRNEMDDINNTG